MYKCIQTSHTCLFWYAQVYSIDKTCRGIACIINVNNVRGMERRYGTDVDRDRLKQLFQQLHFRVQVYNDEDGLRAEVSYLAFNYHAGICICVGKRRRFIVPEDAGLFLRMLYSFFFFPFPTGFCTCFFSVETSSIDLKPQHNTENGLNSQRNIFLEICPASGHVTYF